jgi:predicted outer membrane repeat protein
MHVENAVSRRLPVLLVISLLLMLAPFQAARATRDPGVRYAKPAASGAGACTSWEDACTLQTALTTAINGDDIWVAAGTHKPTAGTDRTATFQLKNGVALYGGFAGTETAWTERNPSVNVTVLSGEIGALGNSDNSYHVVTGATGAILDGFTITAGNCSSVPSPNNRGGGMYNNFSSPTLTNVTFSGNAAAYGGGMQNNGSSPTLTNVTFSGNSADYGGGMENVNSSPTLTNVTFSGNNASGAFAYAGGMSNYSGDPVLTNVTFSGNSANYGGGIYSSGGSLSIRNTIFWGNTATTEGAQIYDDGSGTPSVSDSVVQGGYVGGSNIITTTPMLGVLGNNGGATKTIPLLPGSSAIDTGDDGVCPAADQRGVSRPQGAHCDIGAYERELYKIYLPMTMRGL